MIKIVRSHPPTKLLDKSKEMYQGFYQIQQQGKKIKIRDLWNQLQENNQKVVRERLRSMAEACCSFCGVKLVGSEMDVDHYLPSAHFPFIAYCWDNMLPTCKSCNQSFKRNYVPTALEGKTIIEESMRDEIPHDHVYNKEELLELAKDDRIIDPTFDRVEEHLTFHPAIYTYSAESTIGKKTKEMFFDRDEMIRRIEGISNIVKGLFKSIDSYEEVKEHIENIIEIQGRKFYFYSFYEYWKQQKEAGHL